MHSRALADCLAPGSCLGAPKPCAVSRSSRCKHAASRRKERACATDSSNSDGSAFFSFCIFLRAVNMIAR